MQTHIHTHIYIYIYTPICFPCATSTGKVQKHNGGKFKADKDGCHSIPMPLALAAEHILLDRMAMGEEVHLDLVQSVVSFMIGVWNEKVNEFKDQLTRVSAPGILSQADALLDSQQEDSHAVKQFEKHVSNQMSKLVDALKPINIKKTNVNLEKLWFMYIFFQQV